MGNEQQETRKQKYQQLRRNVKLSTVTKFSIMISMVLGILLFAFLPDSITIQKPKLLQSDQIVAAESLKGETNPNDLASYQDIIIIDHKVTKGETVFSISKQYYSTNNTNRILAYNGITKPEDQVKQGMILSIPNPEFLTIHTVKKDETLFGITNQYFSKVQVMEHITKVNKIKDPTIDIKAGMEIMIPTGDKIVKHIVKENETLYGIVTKYYNLASYQKQLADFNDIHDPAKDLKIGMELKIPNTYNATRVSSQSEWIEIDTSGNRLTYYINNKEVFSTHVATGKNNLTPTGTYEVVLKMKNPTYSPKKIAGGDPNNPLGTRWIGLNMDGTNGRTYGIHGTNAPSSIGSNVSLGCIRMENKKVEWLFDQVVEGTLVIIN